MPGDFVWAGNSKIWIKGYGSVQLQLRGPKGLRLLRISDVAYCPDLLCNIVSFHRLRNQGFWWETRNDPTTLRRQDGSILCELELIYNQWVLEYHEKAKAVAVATLGGGRGGSAATPLQSGNGHGNGTSATRGRITKRPPRKADATRWHKRLGHPGPGALEHLVQQTEGVRLTGITTVQCDACGRAKSKRQIRRIPRLHEDGPGERIAIDFHDYEQGSITKEKSQMLITDRYSGFMWDLYFKDNRPARSIIRLLSNFVTFLKKQFNIEVKVIEADNEIYSVKQDVAKWCDAQGIVIEPSAPDTQAQNGGAERSGGVIKEKARAMRLDANLPWDLWPEVTRSAVYLYNRTPRYSNRWKTPYEVFFTRTAYQNGIATRPRKPDQTHLRAYGCKAFAMTDDTKRGKSRLQRLDPKAWIGYLIGYRSSNIFRVWIPSMSRIINTRDVVFDETAVFSGKEEELMDNLMHSTLEEIATWVRSVELPPMPQPKRDQEFDSFYEDEPVDCTGSTREHPSTSTQKARNCTQQDSYLTPPATPPPVALFTGDINGLVACGIKDQYLSSDLVVRGIKDHSQDLVITDSIKDHGTGLVIMDGIKDQALSGQSTCPWAAAFMAGTQSGGVEKFEGKTLDKAQIHRMLASGKKPHRSQLPEPPKSHDKLENHPLYSLFKEAEKSHLNSHREMRSWEEVPKSLPVSTNQQVLDCMWVYTYKYDKHHRLDKCKARLVVRGDQQRNITAQDTYAATLAGRSFRMLMAMSAKYDLELEQYDVTNAFVHATIDRDIYMTMPRGYRKPGVVLKLRKALYGLRISPLLWQRQFTATLESMGFARVPHEPCSMIKGGVVIFFYVDDIILAHTKSQDKEARMAVDQLKEKYTLTGGKDLQWFLGVEIIRDRPHRKIWLSQASYVDKISRLIDRADQKHDTPMGGIELKPYQGLATIGATRRYQKKIGSLLFAAVTTRPDIAFATSRLARFLTNPSTEHHDAADRVLLYLRRTRTYAILYDGSDSGLVVASDASFADNTIDRKSSQGYAIKLYGGLIAWRANKQDTVTTSTTEAELLALSQTAKEALFSKRLLEELDNKLPQSTIPIQCDNQQTIRLLTEEVSQLQTKLRHVDIHNHWLRQEVARQRIQVVYVPTADMIADGLTKALPANKWARFLGQLGMEDIAGRLTEREADAEEILERMEALDL